MLRTFLLLVIAGAWSSALAADYWCVVSQKFNRDHHYTARELAQGQFAVRIEERADFAYVSRCSYSHGVGEVTCDRYEMDTVVRDPYIGVKKYYEFRGQFDVQLFRDMYIVENNGRGGIAYGRCELVSP